jgi:hypothetical protein
MASVPVKLVLTKKRFKITAKRLRQLETAEATKAANALERAIDLLHTNICAAKGVGMFAVFKSAKKPRAK